MMLHHLILVYLDGGARFLNYYVPSRGQGRHAPPGGSLSSLVSGELYPPIQLGVTGVDVCCEVLTMLSQQLVE